MTTLGWGILEKLFIRILNRTLLVACVVLLIGTIITAVWAGITFFDANNPAIDRGYLAVAYVPLPPLEPTAAKTSSAQDSSAQLSPEDIKLMSQATPGCQALGHFASAITNGRLQIIGSSLTTCEKAQLTAAKAFDDRAANYLSEFATYFSQLSKDAHLSTRYQNLSDGDASVVVEREADAFTAKFRGMIEAQNSKNQAALADASVRRLTALSSLGAAGAAFFAFLLIAFQIVFLRIEKHLEKMSDSN